MKRLRPSDINPNPYKVNQPSPLRDLLYIRNSAKYIRVDPAHTFAIDGIGKSYLASAIVLLMHMGAWGGGSTEHKLQNAYSRFMAYNAAYGKSTSIDEFSFKTLKLPVNSLLSCTINELVITHQYTLDF